MRDGKFDEKFDGINNPAVDAELGYLAAVIDGAAALRELKEKLLAAYSCRATHFGLNEIPANVSRGMTLLMRMWADANDMEQMMLISIGGEEMGDADERRASNARQIVFEAELEEWDNYGFEDLNFN